MQVRQMHLNPPLTKQDMKNGVNSIRFLILSSPSWGLFGASPPTKPTLKPRMPLSGSSYRNRRPQTSATCPPSRFQVSKPCVGGEERGSRT